MKAIIPMSLAVVFCTLFSYENISVIPSERQDTLIIETSNEETDINKSGLDFTVYNSNINTKYSEFSSATFKNKLIVVSSKKIGGLGNGLDRNTNEPYTELFCLDFDSKGDISNPLLFSRILNTKHNEGHVSFSPDESTIYYTRSLRENTSNYQLYKADLAPGSHGNWVDETQLTFNSQYSIENPHVSPDGKHLFFSSNKQGGQGGYDLYVAEILKNGAIGVPTNLGREINGPSDEKFPFMSKDGKNFFFASNGHFGLGGFDLYVSKVTAEAFEIPVNLGDEVNSSFDEVSLSFISDTKGYFSSNKTGGKGSFDIYCFEALPIAQIVQGIIVDNQTNQPIPESKVVLLDETGQELSTQTTGADAHFSFSIKAFENYKLKILKPGFEANEFAFEANNTQSNIYKQVLKLSAKNRPSSNKE
ncbi:MAG: PD40 domain-containing protein [Bacteroidia bacterium]|nr:PD40 domain-containing protein [Bacteroidia bacterium]NND52857.1 hypothetical protein [Flavobacteriaceae bacterium]